MLAATLPACAQAPAVLPASAAAATESLRPTLSRISEVLSGLSVSRWKAPGEVRSVSQRDIDSIQRDLSATLPPMMEQAKLAPGSVAASFAVYRNVDALYDVLLRVSETASLAGTPADADNLQASLTGLEAARRDLGDAIFQSATSDEQEIVELRAAAAQAAAAAAAVKPMPPVKTVVEDGPATSVKPPPAKRKRKPVSPPVNATPAPQ